MKRRRTKKLRKGKSLSGHTHQVRAISITPDGCHAASVDSDGLCHWDLRKGKCLRKIKGFKHPLWAVTISLDAKKAVVASHSGGEDDFPQVFDLQTGELLGRLKLWDAARWAGCVAIDPGGKNVLVGTPSPTIMRYDLGNLELTGFLEGHTSYVNTIAIDPAGKYVLSGGGNERDFDLRLWAFDRFDGKASIVNCRAVLKGHNNTVTCLCINYDGTRAISGDITGRLILWDIASARHLHTLQENGHRILSVAFSSQQGIVFSGSKDQAISVWDANNGSLLQKRSLGVDVNALVWISREDKRMFLPGKRKVSQLLSTGSCGDMILWHVT